MYVHVDVHCNFFTLCDFIYYLLSIYCLSTLIDVEVPRNGTGGLEVRAQLWSGAVQRHLLRSLGFQRKSGDVPNLKICAVFSDPS